MAQKNNILSKILRPDVCMIIIIILVALGLFQLWNSNENFVNSDNIKPCPYPVKTTVTMYMANYCPVSQQVAPLFNDLSKSLTTPHYEFKTVDVEMKDNEEQVKRVGIFQVPTFTIVKDGQGEIYDGSLDKTKFVSQFRAFFENHKNKK